MLMFEEIEIVETEIVVTEDVVTEDVVTEVALMELVIIQFEFALLLGVVLQWGSSGPSPLPAM